MDIRHKFIQAKSALSVQGEQASCDSSSGRIPPGQNQVENFPVLDLGTHPDISPQTWTLRLFGLVERDLNLSWSDFQALPQKNQLADFHCVTHWTQLDMDWQGVSAASVIALAHARPEAHFLTLHGYDDYTVNLPLAALLDDDVILAHSVFGQALSREHGGPVRLVVPKRYGWKSVKWLKAIEFQAENRPGFWESRGYHNEGDPWREERFSGMPKDE
ncbi:MAG: sulfite oxidase-like oxidoreductase [Burkholderiales bacterium]